MMIMMTETIPIAHRRMLMTFRIKVSTDVFCVSAVFVILRPSCTCAEADSTATGAATSTVLSASPQMMFFSIRLIFLISLLSLYCFFTLSLKRILCHAQLFLCWRRFFSRLAVCILHDCVGKYRNNKPNDRIENSVFCCTDRGAITI